MKSWWPNGYGSQTMYTMWVTFRAVTDNEEDTKKYNIAFRTVELVQDPIEGSKGNYLVYNMIKVVYCKAPLTVSFTKI